MSAVQHLLFAPGIPAFVQSHTLVSLFGFSIVATLLFVVFTVVYRLYFHPLASFPGPKLWATTDVFWAVNFLSGRVHHNLIDLHKQYGPIIRTATNNLSIIDPTAWKTIHGSAGTKRFQKANYANLRVGVSSLLNANDADHVRQRKTVSHAFSDRALRDQEGIVMSYVDTLIAKLKGKASVAKDGAIVDLVPWYEYITFDIIGDLAFGEPFGCLQGSNYHPWVAMFTSVVKGSSVLGIARMFSPLDKIILKLVPAKTREELKAHMNMACLKVQKRIATKTERPDFWSYILKHDESGMTPEEMEINGGLFIIAGSETTATALSGTTYALCKNPDTLKLLQDEIRGAFANEEDITMLAVGQLKYLHAVLVEGMRLYPPVPTGASRWTPAGGETIAGAFVPGGTLVAIPQLAAYRSPNNFSDPETYAPSRWLGDAKYASDAQDMFQPFSIGPRNCVGKNLAWAEMKVILARMVWNFDMQVEDDGFNPLLQKALILWVKPALNIRLTPRKL